MYSSFPLSMHSPHQSGRTCPLCHSALGAHGHSPGGNSSFGGAEVGAVLGATVGPLGAVLGALLGGLLDGGNAQLPTSRHCPHCGAAWRGAALRARP